MSTISQIPRHIINMANYDAHSLEAMDQTLLNLSNLEEIGSDIFNKIFTQIQSIHTKMKSISERINQSKTKIDLLINSPTKFIKTFNQNELEQNKNLFAEYMLTPNLFKTDQSIFSKQHHTPQEQGKAAEVAKLDEYLKMVNSLYGKIKQKKVLFEGKDAIQNQQLEGLGTIPKNIQYIDSMLVFNSTTNPYSHYTSFDNMKLTETANKIQKAQKQNQENLLQNAPTTVSERITLQEFQQSKYIYKPQTKAAPQITMTSQLALNGIVDIKQIIQEEEHDDDQNQEIFAAQGDKLKKALEQEEAFELDNATFQQAGRLSNQVGEDLLQTQLRLGQLKNKQSPTSSQQTEKDQPKQYFVFNTFQNQSSQNQPAQAQFQTQQVQSSQTTNLLAMPAPINIPQAPTLNINLSVAPPQPPPLNIQPKSQSIPAPPPLLVNPGAPAPPPMNAPKLNLALPKAASAAPAQPAAGGGSISDLLASIRNPNPMVHYYCDNTFQARLKKVSVLMEQGKPLPPISSNSGEPAKAPPKKQSHMELLRQQVQINLQIELLMQVMLRAGALNRKNKKKDSSDESDSD